MKTRIIYTLTFLLFMAGTYAQVGISADGSHPDPSAGLDINFNNKGVLIPRLTFDQQQAITAPAEGLMIYCTDCTQDGALAVFSKGTWKTMGGCFLTSPPEGQHQLDQEGIVWNWGQVAGATGYKWNTSNDYASAFDVGSSTSFSETNMGPENEYTSYVWAYGQCGVSFVTTLTQSTQNQSFVCGGPFTDTRDNKVYGTIKIGNQCWFSQNLNAGTMISHTTDQSNNNVIEKHCFNDQESGCDTYGALYQWKEFMNYTSSSSSNPSGRQGICPSGWHVPSNAEFSQLTAVLGGENTSGGALKESGTTHWSSPNTGASNSSGFNGLPGGMNTSTHEIILMSYYGFFWTATESTSSVAWIRQLSFNNAGIQNLADEKMIGLSVRCVQD